MLADSNMRYKLPRTIMIDLDDTIIANEVNKNMCWQHIKEEFSSTDYDIENIVETNKKTAEWFWSDPVRHKEGRQDLENTIRVILRLTFEKLEMPGNDLSEMIADRFNELRISVMKPFPGAIETLEFLRERCVRLALVTNGGARSQREKVERFGLSEYFDYIYIEGEHEHGKPDHEVYNYTLRKLETAHSDAWMMGDKYEWEVVAPTELGIKSIWVNSQRRKVVENGVRPFLTLSTFSELLDYVE